MDHSVLRVTDCILEETPISQLTQDAFPGVKAHVCRLKRDAPVLATGHPQVEACPGADCHRDVRVFNQPFDKDVKPDVLRASWRIPVGGDMPIV